MSETTETTPAGEVREKVARIIDPDEWMAIDRQKLTLRGRLVTITNAVKERSCKRSLAKADAIHALYASIPVAGAGVVDRINAKLAECVAYDEESLAELLKEPSVANAYSCTPRQMWEQRLALSKVNAKWVAAEIAAALAPQSPGAGVVEAAQEALELLEAEVFPTLEDPHYGHQVRELGERIGYGALMVSASASWSSTAKGGEFTVGACRATVQAVVTRLRTALANPAPPASADEREAEVMRQWGFGNLTRLGVANGLVKAGFRHHIAVEKANALKDHPAPPARGVESLAAQIAPAIFHDQHGPSFWGTLTDAGRQQYVERVVCAITRAQQGDYEPGGPYALPEGQKGGA